MQLKKWLGVSSKSTTFTDELFVGSTRISVFVFIEQRNGYRSSFAKKGVHIRIPNYLSTIEQQERIASCKAWAVEVLQKKPKLLKRYQQKQYQNGDVISCFDQEFTIEIHKAERTSIKTVVENDKLLCYILPTASTKDILPKHISKGLAKYYKPFFKQRLDYWNALLPVQYKTLRLKYNSSNWGSCSSKQNINLSTRLLLCPLPIIDYVMVHELSHLVHKNHGKQFWNCVATILPDYKESEQWLKTKGAYLDF